MLNLWIQKLQIWRAVNNPYLLNDHKTEYREDRFCLPVGKGEGPRGPAACRDMSGQVWPKQKFSLHLPLHLGALGQATTCTAQWGDLEDELYGPRRTLTLLALVPRHLDPGASPSTPMLATVLK